MSAAEELAAAYVAWQDIQVRQNGPRGRADDWRHEGKRDVAQELDEQTERNLAVSRLMAAESAYRAEVGL